MIAVSCVLVMHGADELYQELKTMRIARKHGVREASHDCFLWSGGSVGKVMFI